MQELKCHQRASKTDAALHHASQAQDQQDNEIFAVDSQAECLQTLP